MNIDLDVASMYSNQININNLFSFTISKFVSFSHFLSNTKLSLPLPHLRIDLRCVLNYIIL